MEKDRLIGFIKKLGSAAVAFSGGVDSSVVCKAAYLALGGRAVAVTVASELVPERDVADAAKVAEAIGIRHAVARVNALENERVASNPPERCYHCKSDDFSAIRDKAREFGIDIILDGTNADDPKGHRPGIRALGELGVISPLMELGYTKADVRLLAEEFDLPNASKPSSPCLASRFPYGQRLTAEGIGRVREAEEFLFSLGFKELRVRDHGGIARIELDAAALPLAAEAGVRQKIVAKLLSIGYNYVTLDLEGFRSGSMDRDLEPR